MAAKRVRTVGSHKTQLVSKAREAMLCAIRTFNDPHVSFKSENYVVLAIIAWTYLLHAYYRMHGVEYRYFAYQGKRRKFDRTKHGAFKYWELERCLNEKKCPLDKDTSNNLRFLIALRHEIEHQMSTRVDHWLSGRYQACSLNFNFYLKKLFGSVYALDGLLSFSIQFADLTHSQATGSHDVKVLPQNLQRFIAEFDGALDHESYNNERYSYRLVFKKKLVNRPGQADMVMEFIDPDSDLAKTIDKSYWVKKEVERPKYRAKDVVEQVQKAGFPKFNVYGAHTRMWQAEDARNPAKGYAVEVQGAWYWYQTWVERCIELCEQRGNEFR